MVPVHFDPLRRLPQRRWQAISLARQSQPLRWLVALFLLPVGLAIASAGSFFAFLLILDAQLTLGAGLLVPLLSIALAFPISWLIAPMAMSSEERGCRPPPGSRPQLVASNSVVAC